MNLSIEIEEDGWRKLADVEAVVSRAAAAALPAGEARSVDVLLTNDAEMQEINREWRGKDKPTNVLSFPAAHQPLPEGVVAHLGDIVLAWETVRQEAENGGKSLEHHLSHLVVHGLLHLRGFDHETESEAELMEAEEAGILAGLGIADPYHA